MKIPSNTDRWNYCYETDLMVSCTTVSERTPFFMTLNFSLVGHQQKLTESSNTHNTDMVCKYSCCCVEGKLQQITSPLSSKKPVLQQSQILQKLHKHLRRPSLIPLQMFIHIFDIQGRLGTNVNKRSGTSQLFLRISI